MRLVAGYTFFFNEDSKTSIEIRKYTVTIQKTKAQDRRSQKQKVNKLYNYKKWNMIIQAIDWEAENAIIQTIYW